jgi:hypothetical protein
LFRRGTAEVSELIVADTFGKIKAAVVQSAGSFLDRDGAVWKAEKLIEEASAKGAQIVVFPEGFIPAHPLWFHFHSATSAAGLELADRHRSARRHHSFNHLEAVQRAFSRCSKPARRQRLERKSLK